MRNYYPILIAFFTSLSFGQTLSYEKTFGGTAYDNLNVFKNEVEDNFYLFGFSNSSISGNKSENSRGESDYWLLKLDSDFNIIWDKTYGGDLSDEGVGAVVSNSGLYIYGSSWSAVSGEKTVSSYGNTDIWLLSLDTSGAILWQEVYGGSATEYYPHVIDFSDTSLLLLTISNSPISGNKSIQGMGGTDIWVVEISKYQGTIIQQKVISTIGINGIGCAAKNEFNNHIYLSSSAMTGQAGDKSEVGYGGDDAWLIELDENLDLIQEKVFGGSNWDQAFSSIEFDENFIYLACSSHSGISGNKSAPAYSAFNSATFHDIWVLKLDYDFSIVWDKSLGGNRDDYSSYMALLEDGKILVSGVSKSLPNSGNLLITNFGTNTFDVLVSILDESGNILTQQNYGGDQNDWGNVIEGYNGEYILCSHSASGISGNKAVAGYGDMDTWISKLHVQEMLALESKEITSFNIFPNPTVDILTINIKGQVAKYEVHDLNGKILLNGIFHDYNEHQLDVSALKAGIYFIKVNGIAAKFVKT